MTKPRFPIRALIFASLAAVLPLGSLPGRAQEQSAAAPGNVMSMAEREIARRQESASQAELLALEGDQAMREKDLELAVEKYRMAYGLLPDSLATGKLRKQALDKFCDASVQLAEQRISEGEYDQAQSICEEVLDDEFAPEFKPAQVLLTRLEDPDYYNKTIDPRHIEDINEVKQLFTEAEGFYATGRYGLAMKRYEQVLNIDSTNSAARRGQDRVSRTLISRYGVDAYNEYRSRALWQLSRSWESPVQEFGISARELVQEQESSEMKLEAEIKRKLRDIVIPEVKFED